MQPLQTEATEVIIRPYREEDWVAIWAMLEPVFRAGETYAFDRQISEEQARIAWTAAPKEAFVALKEETGEVLGTYYLLWNLDGPGRTFVTADTWCMLQPGAEGWRRGGTRWRQ